jgi:hypothetical protein
VVFGVCRLIDLLVPDVPESLELKIKRERYLAKQALADADSVVMVNITLYTKLIARSTVRLCVSPFRLVMILS